MELWTNSISTAEGFLEAFFNIMELLHDSELIEFVTVFFGVFGGEEMKMFGKTLWSLDSYLSI